MVSFGNRQRIRRALESKLFGAGLGLGTVGALAIGASDGGNRKGVQNPPTAGAQSVANPSSTGLDQEWLLAAFTPDRLHTLKVGDKGALVRELQERINSTALFPEIIADGNFGPKTEALVKAFQRQRGLTIDGKVGPQTWRQLNEVVAENRKAGGILSRIGLGKSVDDVTRPKMASNDCFNLIIDHVFLWEGGVNSDSKDSGNAGGNVTNKGVTQAAYDSYRRSQNLPRQSTLRITRDEAEDLFRTMYWTKASCELLPEKLAMVQLDTAINMGVDRANRLLQRTLNQAGARLEVDGKLGQKTWAALGWIITTETDAKRLTGYYLALRAKDYHAIAERGSNRRFLKGWLYRLEKLEVVTDLKPSPPPLLATRPGEPPPECVPLDDPRIAR